jgi:hypothetical protein
MSYTRTPGPSVASPYFIMHHALEIPEIVEHIFEYCERSALASAIRTCHPLSEFALDALWGIYGNFDALISLLPEDIELQVADYQLFSCPVSFQNLRVVLSTMLKRTQRFSRPLLPSYWALINKHIHRLRKIDICNENISPESLHYFCETCPSRFLFPNIRSLRLCLCAEDSINNWNLEKVFSPHIQIFQVDDIDHKVNLCNPALPLLPTRCPNLKEINLYPDDSPEAEWLSDVICQYNGLERIHVPRQALSPRAISHIINLRYIIELEIYCTQTDSYALTSAYILPHLRSWSHESETLDPFISILSHLHPNAKLEDLSVRVTTVHSATQLQEVLEMVNERVNSTSLQIFDIYYDEYIPDTRTAQIHLNPTLPFRDLRSLHIASDSSSLEVDLDDADLLTLASSCPQLRSLRLPTNPSSITAIGLVALLDNCPELRDVAIQFTFSAPRLETLNHGLYPKLVSLEVGNSLVKDSMGGKAVALERSFPSISRVRYSEDGEDYAEWEKINRYFRSTR